jgi:hypothetical protein
MIMNNSSFAPRLGAAAAPMVARPDVRLPRLRALLRAVSAWLDEPGRRESLPIAGGMYGLWLRPADHPAIHRENHPTKNER